MSCITYFMMKKLKAVGFSFPAYEDFKDQGRVFYYQDREYHIGGFVGSGYTEIDDIAAKEGCWLPTETELLEWLWLVDIDVSIQSPSQRRQVHVDAKDCINGMEYSASGGDLAFALYKVIYKICKSKLRPYVPAEIERLEIDSI